MPVMPDYDGWKRELLPDGRVLWTDMRVTDGHKLVAASGIPPAQAFEAGERQIAKNFPGLLTEHERKIIQSHGVPPMSFPVRPQIENELPAVRYDPAAAETATLHPPGCSCPPCQLSQSKETVSQQGKKISELENDNRELTRHNKEIWAVANDAVNAESRIRKNMDRVASNARETREVAVVPEIRIGDAERNAYTEHLGNMLADGHLTMDEFSQRSDLVTAAKTLAHLKTLVEDLPPMPSQITPGALTVPRTPFLERMVPVPALLTGAVITAVFLLLLVIGVL